MAIPRWLRWFRPFLRNRSKPQAADLAGEQEVALSSDSSAVFPSGETYHVHDAHLAAEETAGKTGLEIGVEALRSLIENGDFERAGSSFEALLTDYPDDSAAYLLGAAALHAAGRTSEAYDGLRLAERRFPAEAWPLQSQIEFLQKDGNWYEIGQCAARMRLVAPGASEGYKFGLLSLQRRNRLTDIGPLIETATKALPAEEWLLEAAVIHQLRDGQFRAAAESADRLRELYPGNVAGYREGGLALRRLNRFDDAEAVLQAASVRFPADNWVVIETAWLELRRGHLDAAVSLASKAREADADSYPGYLIAIEALRVSGRLDEAQALLAEAASKLTHTAWLAGEGALIAEARPDHVEASRVWQSVREDFPNDVAGYLGGVRTARVAGRLEEAEAIFLAGREAVGASAALLAEGAQVAVLRQAFNAAYDRWAALRSLEPRNESAYRRGIAAAESWGRPDLALSCCMKRSSTSPLRIGPLLTGPGSCPATGPSWRCWRPLSPSSSIRA